MDYKINISKEKSMIKKGTSLKYSDDTNIFVQHCYFLHHFCIYYYTEKTGNRERKSKYMIQGNIKFFIRATLVTLIYQLFVLEMSCLL